MPQRRIDQVFEWYHETYKDEMLMGMSDLWLKEGYSQGYESAEIAGNPDPFVYMNHDPWCKKNADIFGVRRYLRAFERGRMDALGYAAGGILKMSSAWHSQHERFVQELKKEQPATISVNVNIDDEALRAELNRRIATFFEDFAKGLRK